MKTLARFAALAASLALSSLALARGIATVTIIDRDSGTALSTYYYHGEYWVAGRPGARYSIEIRNCTGGRVLAVTSVDGVNVLSGETAGVGQAGYVFDPGEGYEITGWRKSNREVAAFTFTDAGDSYAGRTGRPANIGVIGVALFRERVPAAVYSPSPPADFAREAPNAPIASASVPAPAPAPAPAQQESLAGATRMQIPPAAKLGTGHGDREYSYVVDTEFERTQPQPNELIRIRYDSFENLVALGVIRRPLRPLAQPNPFPESPQRGFVPDPPG
jgi:hypothetical protein